MADYAYNEIAKATFNCGFKSDDRTNTGTVSLPFQMSKYDLSGLRVPLLSMKKVNERAVRVELEWYLRGESNIKFLQDNGVHIWDAWADENLELGPVYGCQWRKWEDTRVVAAEEVPELEKIGYQVVGVLGDERVVVQRFVDQLQDMVNTLRNTPDARRIILTAWNVGKLRDMKLPPCHMTFQVCSKVLPEEDRSIHGYNIGLTHLKYGYESNYAEFVEYVNSHLQGRYEFATHEAMDEFKIPRRGLFSGLYQRSVDVMVGMPFNISGYAILTHFIAQITDHMAVEFTHFGGDVHIYSDHFEGYETQMAREPIGDNDPVVLFPEHYWEIDDFAFEEVVIEGYKHHPFIKFPVAV
ncbi:thymidylate synthase [Photobacterium ganghwense]|uniref:thymidylate synthase n=1 Tax=Photobacterium ganghwense TaxID=320778 RepID=UPI001A8F4CDF|nr:thymidylate synthase [Photobacterium ganghwense]QSV17146.1 thymidylate synthase [Photobacterium ganghwense]